MEDKRRYLAFLAFLSFLSFMGFKNPIYFLYLFFLFFLFYLAPSKQTGESKTSSLLIEKQAKEKAEHLKKIVDFIFKKDRITNDDVQKLLGVSDATAERYLNELEKEAVLTQKGENKGVFYQKKG